MLFVTDTSREIYEAEDREGCMATGFRIAGMGRFLMQLDPDTTVADLLRAVPSSALAFKTLGITVTGKKNQALRRVCADQGIAFDEFLRAMDEIDWEEEAL